MNYNVTKIELTHWLDDKVNSSVTGKPMTIINEIVSFVYKDRCLNVEYQSYYCVESNQYYTTTSIDTLNLQRIQRKYDELFYNTLVICEFKVYRLVGIKDDGHDDVYILEPFMGKQLEHHSILTGFIPLHEKLTADEYNHEVRQWNRNNQTQIEEVI